MTRKESGERAAAQDGEGSIGGTQQRSIFVENDGDRNVGEELRELTFVGERLAERALLQERKNFDGDTTSEIDTAIGENAESEVTGFRAEGIGPELQRVNASLAGSSKRVLRDFLSGFTGRLVERLVTNVGCKKFMNRAEAP